MVRTAAALGSAAFRQAVRLAARRVLRSAALVRLATAVAEAVRRHPPGLGSLRGELATLARLVRNVATRRYRAFPRRSLIAVVAGMLYFLNPLDLVMDVVPLLGLADDVVVLSWVLHQVRRDLKAYRTWEADWGNAVDVEGYVVAEPSPPPPALLTIGGEASEPAPRPQPPPRR